MSDYGVTKNGFVRKRYDTIYSELQGDIKDGLGIDVSINPKSFFNVLLSSVADKLAVAWELAEMVYYSHYPATAEGINLDYACQFGGLTGKVNGGHPRGLIYNHANAFHRLNPVNGKYLRSHPVFNKRRAGILYKNFIVVRHTVSCIDTPFSEKPFHVLQSLSCHRRRHQS